MTPAESRGRVEIADRVPERIATQVIAEFEQAGGLTRRLLGLAVMTGRSRVSARVDGSLVTMRVSVSVAYPAPIRQVVSQLRERVIERVGELTGLRVGQVDVEVAALVSREGGGS